MRAVCGHWRVVWNSAKGFSRCPMCEIEKQPFFRGVPKRGKEMNKEMGQFEKGLLVGALAGMVAGAVFMLIGLGW